MGFKFIRIGRWQPIRMRFNWRATLLAVVTALLMLALSGRVDWASPNMKSVIGVIIPGLVSAIVATSIERMLPRRGWRVATILSFSMSLLFLIYGVVNLIKGVQDQAVLSLTIFGLVFMLGIYCIWRWRRHYNLIVERKATIEMISARRKRSGL